MQKIKELRMALVILVIGVFFISGCFFDKKYEVTFKTNGGSKLDSLVIKSGSKIEDVEEPTKEGYKFLGWYSNGKEFDFDKKIEEDVTLVAKWEKVEIDYEVEDEEEETTTTSTTKKTTVKKATSKKTSTKKKTTTSKKTTTTKATTTKETTTKETTTSTTTTTTTASTTSTTTTSTTSTTTSTTTTVPVEITTKPIDTVVPVPTPTPDEPTTTVPVEVKMSISEVQKSVDNQETPDIDETSYVITLDLQSETHNIENNISDEDYAKLIASDKTKWVIENNYDIVYENIYDINILDKFKLECSETDIQSLLIFDGENHYTLDYDSVEAKWSLNYPVATVGVGLDVKYYGNINLAFVKAIEGDTVTLLKDIELKETVRIYDAITIDGGGYKLSLTDSDIFIIGSLFKEDKVLTINNLVVDCYNFMNISSDTKLEKVLVKDSNIKYSNKLFNDDITVVIDYENTAVTSILN